MPTRYKSFDDGQRLAAFATFRPQAPTLGAVACAIAAELEGMDPPTGDGWKIERIAVRRDNPSKRGGIVGRWFLAVYWFRVEQRQ
jgi:hypothetical protein